MELKRELDLPCAVVEVGKNKYFILVDRTELQDVGEVKDHYLYRDIEITSSNKFSLSLINPLAIDKYLDSGKFEIVPWSELDGTDLLRVSLKRVFTTRSLKNSWNL